MCLIEGSEHIKFYSEVIQSIIMKYFHVIATHTRTEPIKFERSKFIDDVTKNRQNLNKRHSFVQVWRGFGVKITTATCILTKNILLSGICHLICLHESSIKQS